MILDASEGHGPECQCSLCVLSKLDKGTEWVEPRNLRPDGEEGGDDGMAGVPSVPYLRPIDGGAVASLDSLDDVPTAADIVSTVRDMALNGVVEDLLIIVNTPDGEQVLMTTLNRNDHIIGMLSVATMNWWGAQISAQNMDIGEEEEV